MESASNFIYINSEYCYSLGNFKACLENMLRGKDINQEIPNLKYWLKPLIKDGVLKSWLANLNDNEANAIMDELKNADHRTTESVIHRILMALEIE